MSDVSLLLSAFSTLPALAGLTAALAIGCAGLVLLVFVCLAGAGSRQLNLHLARHLIRLSAVTGLVLLCAAVAWCLCAPRVPVHPTETGIAAALGLNGFIWWNAPYRCAVLAAVGLCAALPVVALALSAGWKKLRGTPAVIWFGTFLMALAALGVCALGTGITDELFPGVKTALAGAGMWLSGLTAFFGGLTAGGALALLWLLIRRNFDDFGRDYYAFAARKCARFTAGNALITLFAQMALQAALLVPFAGETAAAFPGLPAEFSWEGVLAACSGWNAALGTLVTAALARDASLLIVAPAALVATLLAAFMACLIARAAIPMRHKPSMALSWAFLFLGAVCLSRLLSVFSS